MRKGYAERYKTRKRDGKREKNSKRDVERERIRKGEIQKERWIKRDKGKAQIICKTGCWLIFKCQNLSKGQREFGGNGQ